MVQGLVSAMDSVWYILLLLMLLVYIFAVLGVILFAGNDPANFNDVATAMMVSKCILQWRNNPSPICRLAICTCFAFFTSFASF